MGKIPFPFDPNFDKFVISPDGSKVLLNKDGRNLFLYFLFEDDFTSSGDVISLPYLRLPRNTTVKDILWSKADTITVLTSSIEKGGSRTSVFRLTLDLKETALAFRQVQEEGIRRLSISEDEKYVAALKDNSVVIKDYSTWKDLVVYPHSGPIDALWRSDTECIITGNYITEVLDIGKRTGSLVCSSQPEKSGYSSDGSILVKNLGKSYKVDDAGAVTITSSFDVENRKCIFAVQGVPETFLSSGYRNLIMVRSVAGYGTNPLFSYPGKDYEPFPDREEKVDPVNFSHGSRIRRREVSLVFNAIDSVEGLTEVLNTLSDYRIRATFFINGDFIRRNPEATREIANSGHEVGSCSLPIST